MIMFGSDQYLCSSSVWDPQMMLYFTRIALLPRKMLLDRANTYIQDHCLFDITWRLRGDWYMIGICNKNALYMYAGSYLFIGFHRWWYGFTVESFMYLVKTRLQVSQIKDWSSLQLHSSHQADQVSFQSIMHIVNEVWCSGSNSTEMLARRIPLSNFSRLWKLLSVLSHRQARFCIDGGEEERTEALPVSQMVGQTQHYLL